MRRFLTVFADLADSLRFIGQDFIAGKTFWIPAALLIVSCIVGVAELGRNMPRMDARLTISDQEFESFAGKMLPRDEFLAELKSQIQQALVKASDFPFRGKQDDAGEPTREAKIGVERLISKVRFKVKAQVTNSGTVPSTVSSVSIWLMETIGGRSFPLGPPFWSEEEVNLPAGKPTKLGNPDGQTVEFTVLRSRLTDYQIVALVGGALRDKYPKETTQRYEMLKAYLQLLGIGDLDYQDRLLQIAEQSNDARVYLLLTVTDIHRRNAESEAQILNSGAWK